MVAIGQHSGWLTTSFNYSSRGSQVLSVSTGTCTHAPTSDSLDFNVSHRLTSACFFITLYYLRHTMCIERLFYIWPHGFKTIILQSMILQKTALGCFCPRCGEHTCPDLRGIHSLYFILKTKLRLLTFKCK